ncbi:MAG: hypothetical protein DCF16_08750 [Alphaproteobacteria bacterium]|nr:MAG: hypothetical protein DCF16_08750 [Alphaproteobacteria bacterium]
MRMGGTYEAYELTLRQFKFAWLQERAQADVVVGVAEDPGRSDSLWTVVSFRQSATGGAPTLRVIDGDAGVFEPQIETREIVCPTLDLPFQGLVQNFDNKRARSAKTSIVPNPEYVLITGQREYHFFQLQDEATANQLDAILADVDACIANSSP